MLGGQKQQAAIARAFIGNPQLIPADEPTASLEPDRGQEIAQLICKEVKSKNKSAVIGRMIARSCPTWTRSTSSRTAR